MKWKERVGLALSGALIGLTLLLIVDVHYRLNNINSNNNSQDLISGSSSSSNSNSDSNNNNNNELNPNPNPNGEHPYANHLKRGIPDGGGEVGRSPLPHGGDTAENAYANSKLTNGARINLRGGENGNQLILQNIQHAKVQYIQPNNMSQLTMR